MNNHESPSRRVSRESLSDWANRWSASGAIITITPTPAMPIPTHAGLRAVFREALMRARGNDCIGVPHHPEAGNIIRAAVDVVLGDPANDKLRPTTARHRAAFLALADAIQGDD